MKSQRALMATKERKQLEQPADKRLEEACQEVNLFQRAMLFYLIWASQMKIQILQILSLTSDKEVLGRRQRQKYFI